MKRTFKHSKFTAVFTDENGYYSFTGDCLGGSGAVGDSIVEIFPDLAPLNNVHLCDVKSGAPIHAIANAKYFLNKGDENAARRALHVNDARGENLFSKYRGAIRSHESLMLTKGGHDTRLFERAHKDSILEISHIEDCFFDYWLDAVEKALETAADLESNLSGTFVDPYDLEFLDFCERPEKIVAIAKHLDIDVSEISEDSDTMYSGCGKQFYVLTDPEADEMWDESLDEYLDSCLIPELPETAQQYFDRDAWKRDARYDGRGHCLNHYDGHEYSETINGETYYIYQI